MRLEGDLQTHFILPESFTARVAYMGRSLIASSVLTLWAVRGGQLIREARLRAGLTQTELADRTGRERSVIARWEQGAVSPSVDNLLAIVEACGYDLPLVLIPRDTSDHQTLDEMRMLSPERRLERFFAKREAQDPVRG